MCMQVYVQANFSIINLLLDGFLNSPNCWLLLFRWVGVISVEVLPKSVKSVIAAINTVRGQHRHDFKDKTIAENLALLALFIGEELPNAIQHKARWCLTRVHTRRDKNCWFVEFEWPCVYIILRVRKTPFDNIFSLFEHLCFGTEGD